MGVFTTDWTDSSKIEEQVSEEAIRLRGYEIWQREGCQDGKAVEHWFRAKAELAAERDCREIVAFPTEKGVPASRPPKKATSRRAPRRRPTA